MPENIVYDPNSDQQDNQANQPEAQIAPGSIQDPQFQGGEGEAPPDGGDPNAPAEEYYDEAPPPGGITGFVKSRKFIFIIVGIIVILVIIFLIFLLIPKNEKGKDITLVWWGLWEDNATMQPLIDNFEKENPGIKIEYTKQDPEKYRDTLITRINNGTGPDIFRYHNTWTPTLNKIIAPLSKDVISVENFNKQYFPVVQKDLLLKGAIYGVPLGIDSIALFINQRMLDEAGLAVPTDWYTFINAAKKMTVKEADSDKIIKSGAALGTYGNIKHAPDIISVMLLQQGVDITKLSKQQEEVLAALTFYTSFSRGKENVWDNSLDNSMLAFAKGDLAMYFGYSWDVFAIEQIRENSNSNFEYGIYPVPRIGSDKGITIASYWVEGVSVKSRYQKEAMIFMNYLTQIETLQRLFTEASKTREFGAPYPRVDMAEELKGNSRIYPFINNLDVAGSSYFASDTHDGETGINSRLNKYLENFVNAVIMKGSSSDSEFTTFQTGVSKVLNENGIK